MGPGSCGQGWGEATGLGVSGPAPSIQGEAEEGRCLKHRRRLLGAAISQFIESDRFARMSMLVPSQKGTPQAGLEPVEANKKPQDPL